MDFFRKLNRARTMLSIVLIAFLLMRAVVPAGFMPSDGSTSSLYMYCYGDSGARQLTSNTQNAASPQHQHHHAHHGQDLPSTSNSAALTHSADHDTVATPNKFCEYATFSAQLILWALVVMALGWAKAYRLQPLRKQIYLLSLHYFLPTARAPPAVIFIA